MQLPRPIQTYFTARAPQDGGVLAAAFAPDAIVHDEGLDHRGPQAIRDWWLAAKVKYRHNAKPINMTDTAGKTVVLATVTGDFPGSPAVLTFTFGLAADLITDLEIG
ncbi:MAG: nuclear transport factor 2 family protein [Loktanella sp.]|nr:nuclear transport factor 2 family protein [Loktanella sp.]